jgi:hypothetical protein
VVGLGSIGAASAELLLAVSSATPEHIVLADISREEAVLRAFAAHLENTYDLKGRVTVAISDPHLRDEVYESSLLLGATNYPCVIDIDRLRPGSILIDDSYPHSFDVDLAFKRLSRSNDVLFSVAGLVLAPTPIEETRYFPAGLRRFVGSAFEQQLRFRDRDVMTSCTFSSLLSGEGSGLPLTLGHVDLHSSLAHHQRLQQLGFTSPTPRCNGRALTPSQLAVFRGRFGRG